MGVPKARGRRRTSPGLATACAALAVVVLQLVGAAAGYRHGDTISLSRRAQFAMVSRPRRVTAISTTREPIRL